MTARALGLLLCLCAVAGVLWLVTVAQPPPGTVYRLEDAWYFVSADPVPPAAADGWRPVRLPVSRSLGLPAGPAPTWFRLRLDLPREPAGFCGVLLPYFYGGGELWAGGRMVAHIPSANGGMQVRWERPHLVQLPLGTLHAGANELWLHAVPVLGERSLTVPAPLVGPIANLMPLYDRRLFLTHMVPELTVAACLIVSAFVLFIWWRLPEEHLYGWFGLATMLWGIRTLTFVMETVPTDRWPLWRLVYLATTGGFIVVMVLFTCCLAGLSSRWVERGLLLYWLAGPLWFAWQGVASDEPVNRLWTAGLIPIALVNVGVSFYTVWRQRTAGSLLLPAALAFATACGIHDYLIVWQPAWVGLFAPGWADERYFLLHHGANALLLTMGLLLATRFVRTLRSLRELNQTLETRVADRERALAENFERLAYLERRNAAAEERKLIMRDIHDGLGSRLFTSLSRVERGAMDGPQMAASLRQCIADMRLALDTLAPDQPDLIVTFGDFLFRWQSELDAVGVRCTWHIDAEPHGPVLAPHAMLQVLRVAQEALTNVVKHARATRVELTLRHVDDALELVIRDDGTGLAAPSSNGRGIHNMRTRTAQLGGSLAIGAGPDGGTHVRLTLPCPPAHPANASSPAR